MHERLGEQAEPSLVAQTVDRATQEPRAKVEIPGLLRRDPNMDGRNRIGHIGQPHLRDPQQNGASHRLWICQRHDGQQARVILGEPHLLRRIDDVLPSPRLTPRPPAAMRDRNQRAQRGVRIAGVTGATSDRDKRLRSTALRPHIAADHLLQPRQPGRFEFADVERLGVLEQPPDHVDGAKLVRSIRGTHQTLAPPAGIRRQRSRSLQRGRGDHHRPPTPGRDRIAVQRGRDLLVIPHGRHRPMPCPTLRIGHDLRQRAIRLQNLSRWRRLAHRRSHERMTKADLPVHDRDQLRRDRRVQIRDSERPPGQRRCRPNKLLQ